jgi:Ca-activated chloride channel family protein
MRGLAVQAVAVLGALAIAIVLIWRLPTLVQSGQSAAAVPVQATGPCASVNVASSTEKVGLVKEMATDFERHHPCAHVNVYGVDSGKAAAALISGWNAQQMPIPDVYSPAASIWVSVVRQHDTQQLLPTTCDTVTQTPLVIGMPKPMADALGYPGRQVGWSDLFSLVQNTSGWGGLGHPMWGPFQLGRTNPQVSTTGLMTSVGIYYAGTHPHSSSDLTLAEVHDRGVQAFVGQIEQSVIHYADDEEVFLSQLQHEDDRAGDPSHLAVLTYLSAIVLEEKGLWDYNHGNPSGDPATLGKHAPPHVKLVAIYPSEGSPVSNEPYCILHPGVQDARHQVATAFLDFMRQRPQQQRFEDDGFRSYDNRVGRDATPAFGIQPDQPKTSPLPPPTGDVVDAINAGWPALKKKARVLFVLDVSGSMAAPTTGGQTKLQLVQQAADHALDLLAPGDQVGLWVFSTELEQLEPPAALASQQKAAIKASIDALKPEQETALYHSVRLAEDYMQQSRDPKYINAIVLLTDGINTDPTDNNRAGLLSDLQQQAPAGRAIRIFDIGYGSDAEQDTLNSIAQATGGVAYPAGDPGTIDSVFVRITSNF